MLERPFRRAFAKARHMPGDTAHNLLFLLEHRLDTVVYSLGFPHTRPMARQLVTHRHVLVNGRRVNIPSYRVQIVDIIRLTEKAAEIPGVHDALTMSPTRMPSWLQTIETLCAPPSERPVKPASQVFHIANTHAQKYEETPEPTTLLMIDEANRLKTASLEQGRDIFDQGDLGVVLIGMTGLEKRLLRYHQLYSRVGFVHAFRPLSAAGVRDVFRHQWPPLGIVLPDEGLNDEAVMATIIRITGGNFWLLHRLLTQIARLVEINALSRVTREVVEAARENLVIGAV